MIEGVLCTESKDIIAATGAHWRVIHYLDTPMLDQRELEFVRDAANFPEQALLSLKVVGGEGQHVICNRLAFKTCEDAMQH